MMSSSTTFDQNLESTQKPKLRNAFKGLKAHACKVANFTLQWQDLEDHLRFIHSEIESKLQQISAVKAIENDTNAAPSKDLILPESKDPDAKTSKVPVKKGKELILYVKEHLKDHELLHDYLFKIFNAVEEPGKIVLEAVKEFYFLEDADMRKSCRLVLGEFRRFREQEDDDVAEEVRKEAKRLAVEWKGKLKIENSLEVLMFLLLLIDFGLVGEFAFDEIFKLFDYAQGRKPELFRALGLADKAPEYIKKLGAKNLQLLAITYVYAFELVDQFPPVLLLKDHAKYGKKVAKKICRRGKNSFKAQIDATYSEINNLRGIIRYIDKYKLASEYSSRMLKNQIEQMKNQIREMKANTETTASNTQTLHNIDNKRSAPLPLADWNQWRRIGRKRTADLNGCLDISPPVNSTQPSLRERTTSFGGRGTQNSTSPARTNASSPQAVPYVNATSNAHSQHSPNLAAHLLSDLSTVTHHSASSFGNYPFTSSTPITSYASVAVRPYEFAGSDTIHPHTSSSPGMGITTNGRSGQFELSGSAIIRQHTSYSPGLYERGDGINGSFCSSWQFMAGTANAGTNTFSSYYGDLLRASMYNRQVSSSNSGIAPPNTSFNRSGYHDRPVFDGGNHGVSSEFPPSVYRH